MARQMRNVSRLKQGEIGKCTPITRLITVFRNAFTTQGTKTTTTIQWQIVGENPEKLGDKSKLEADRAAADMLVRRAQTLQ